MSVTTDSFLESRHKKPSTWERLNSRQKLLLLASTAGVLAVPLFYLLSHTEVQAGVGQIGGKAVSAGEEVTPSVAHIPTSEQVQIKQDTLVSQPAEWTAQQQAAEEKEKRFQQAAAKINFTDNENYRLHPDAFQKVLPPNESQKRDVIDALVKTLWTLDKLGADTRPLESYMHISTIALVDETTWDEETKQIISWSSAGLLNIMQVDYRSIQNHTPHEFLHYIIRTGIPNFDEGIVQFGTNRIIYAYTWDSDLYETTFESVTPPAACLGTQHIYDYNLQTKAAYLFEKDLRRAWVNAQQKYGKNTDLKKAPSIIAVLANRYSQYIEETPDFYRGMDMPPTVALSALDTAYNAKPGTAFNLLRQKYSFLLCDREGNPVKIKGASSGPTPTSTRPVATPEVKKTPKSTPTQQQPKGFNSSQFRR